MKKPTKKETKNRMTPMEIAEAFITSHLEAKNTACPPKKEVKGVKNYFDEVYAIGFKNGQIEMRNRVLMKLNRDYRFWTSMQNATFLVELLKAINKLPLTKKITPITKVVKKVSKK